MWSTNYLHVNDLYLYIRTSRYQVHDVYQRKKVEHTDVFREFLLLYPLFWNTLSSKSFFRKQIMVQSLHIFIKVVQNGSIILNYVQRIYHLVRCEVIRDPRDGNTIHTEVPSGGFTESMYHTLDADSEPNSQLLANRLLIQKGLERDWNDLWKRDLGRLTQKMR